jgi:ABC-type sulfate/molybdate transport systems ATPase subunit
MPARLSGGQAHRVALGRLLLSHCDALLLDEPYSGLDANLRRTLTDLVVSLVAERDVPSILVAHELAEAQAFADRLAVLDQGQVLQTGAPGEVVLAPATRRVAELVGYTSFVRLPVIRAGLPGSSAAQSADAQSADARGMEAQGVDAQPVAAIHPDRVIAGRHPERGLVLQGVVTACRPAGALWEITVQAGNAAVTGRLAEPAATGHELAVTALDPPVFGPGGERARAPAAGSAGGFAGDQGTIGQTGHSGVRR